MEREIASRRGRSRRRKSHRRERRESREIWRGQSSGNGMWWGNGMWTGPYWGVRPNPSARENPYRTRKLYRDVRHQRIAGVCAGIARYFGMEAWVVRCIAVTGLIFMSQIVVPAYLIAWWVIEPAPNGERAPDAEPSGTKQDHSSPAPELGPQLSPRRSLRDVQWSLDQIELKLRRMETHVTSGQYELQRELKKIDT
jgi:phage shock protein C